MLWALEEAPDVPSQCLSALIGLANHADADGCGAYAGQVLLAEYARKSDRQVRSDLARLLDEKLIRRGDQSLVAHIPADSRPVVYDLAMERKRTSARKSASGRAIAAPKTTERLSDQREHGGAGSRLPDGTGSVLPEGSGSRLPTNQVTTKNSSTKSSRPRRNLNEGREDAMRLCAHLADEIEANGSLRPGITQEWLTEARLLMDKDGRTEAQAHRAITWCQQNTFWRRNVMSMPKLREKYDQLRMQADDERRAPASSNGRGKYAPGSSPSGPLKPITEDTEVNL